MYENDLPESFEHRGDWTVKTQRVWKRNDISEGIEMHDDGVVIVEDSERFIVVDDGEIFGDQVFDNIEEAMKVAEHVIAEKETIRVVRRTMA